MHESVFSLPAPVRDAFEQALKLMAEQEYDIQDLSKRLKRIEDRGVDGEG